MADSFLLVWLDVFDTRALSLAHQLDPSYDETSNISSEDPIPASASTDLQSEHSNALKAASNTYVAILGHPVLSDFVENETCDGKMLDLHWLSPQRAAAALRKAWCQHKVSKTWNANEMAESANDAARLLLDISLEKNENLTPHSILNLSASWPCKSPKPGLAGRRVCVTGLIELVCIVNTRATDDSSSSAFERNPRDAVTGTSLWSMLSAAISPDFAAASTASTASTVRNSSCIRQVRFWDVSAVESGPHLRPVPMLKRPWSTWSKLSGASIWAHTSKAPPLLFELATSLTGETHLSVFSVPVTEPVNPEKESKEDSERSVTVGGGAKKGGPLKCESKRLLDPRGATFLRWQGILRVNNDSFWRGGSDYCNGIVVGKADEIFIEISGIVSERDRGRLHPSPLHCENGIGGGYRIPVLEVMMSLPQAAWTVDGALRALVAPPPPRPSNHHEPGAWVTSPSEAGAAALENLTECLHREDSVLVCRALPAATTPAEKACASSAPNADISKAYGFLNDGYDGTSGPNASYTSESSKSGQSWSSAKQRSGPSGPPPPLYLVLAPLTKASTIASDGSCSLSNGIIDHHAQLQCTFLLPSSAVNPQALLALLSRPPPPLRPLPPNDSSLERVGPLAVYSESAMPLRQWAVTSMPRLELLRNKKLGSDSFSSSSSNSSNSSNNAYRVPEFVHQMQATVVAMARKEANLRRSRNAKSVRRKSSSEPGRQQPKRSAKTWLSSGGVDSESTTAVDAKEVDRLRRIAAATAADQADAAAAWEYQKRAATALAATRIAREATVAIVQETCASTLMWQPATATGSNTVLLPGASGTDYLGGSAGAHAPTTFETVNSAASAREDSGTNSSSNNDNNRYGNVRSSTAAAQYYWHHRMASSVGNEPENSSSSLSRTSSFGVAASATAAPIAARSFSRALFKGGLTGSVARGETKYARGRAIAARASDALEVAHTNKDMHKKPLKSFQPAVSAAGPAVQSATSSSKPAAKLAAAEAVAAPSAAIAALVNANVADEALRQKRRKQRRSRSSKDTAGGTGLEGSASAGTTSNLNALKRNLSTGSIGHGHSIGVGAITKPCATMKISSSSSSSDCQSYTSMVRSYPGHVSRNVDNSRNQYAIHDKKRLRTTDSNDFDAEDDRVSTLVSVGGRGNTTSNNKRREFNRSSTSSHDSQGPDGRLSYTSQDSTGTLLEDDASLGGETSRSSQFYGNGGSEDSVLSQPSNSKRTSSISTANKRKRGSSGAAIRASSLFQELRHQDVESPPAVVRRRLSPGSNGSGGSNSSGHEHTLPRSRMQLFGGTSTRSPAAEAPSPLPQPQSLGFGAPTATSSGVVIAASKEVTNGPQTTAVSSSVPDKVTEEQFPSTSLRSPAAPAHRPFVAFDPTPSPATAAATASASATPTTAVQENGISSGNRLFNSPYPTASVPPHSPTEAPSSSSSSSSSSSTSSSSSPSSSSSMAPPPPRSPSQSPARSSMQSPSRSFVQSPIRQAPSALHSNPAGGMLPLPSGSSPSRRSSRGMYLSPLATSSAVVSTVNATSSAIGSAALPRVMDNEMTTQGVVTLRELIEVEFDHWAHAQSMSSVWQSPTSELEGLGPFTLPTKPVIVDLITAAAADIIAMRQRLSNLPLQSPCDSGVTPADVPGIELTSGELRRLVFLYTDLLGYT